MDWKEKRKNMDDAIKSKVIPILRQNGFKGSYPNFRRVKLNKIDVLGFQFSQWGPQFYVEIGASPKTGVTLLSGTHFPPETIKYYQCMARHRIGDSPFDFENEDFEKNTNRILESLPEAEDWWEKNETL